MNVKVGSISGLALGSKRKGNSYGYGGKTAKPSKPSRLGRVGAKRNKQVMAKPRREMTLPRIGMPSVTGIAAKTGVFVLVTVFLAAVSVGLLAGYRWLTTVNYFALTNITVNGLSRLGKEHVFEKAELVYGANVLSLNIDKIKAELTSDPWVDTASVKRVLPGTLEINVTERVPVFLVQYEGSPYYADASGKLIDKVEPGAFVSLPQIEIEAGMEKHLDLLTKLREMAASSHTPFTMDEVAWIRLSWGRGLEVRLMNQDVSLCMGSKDWERNLYRLNLVWADLKKRNELGRVAQITAQDDKVWVEKRT